MTRPYSEDLRERALARFEAGETIRSIGEALGISPSCVSKWRRLKRDTGSLSPGQIGGHKPRVLSGELAAWLRKRCRSGPFTTRGLTAELAARGIKTDRRAVWVFVRAEGLSFKKTLRAAEQQRADVARARWRWMREQGLFDPARLVFIDESVLQSTEGVQHELKPFVKLRERWGRAPRDRLSGAGLKPVRAAAVKSRGCERRIKSSDQTEQVSVRKTNESEPSDDASL